MARYAWVPMESVEAGEQLLEMLNGEVSFTSNMITKSSDTVRLYASLYHPHEPPTLPSLLNEEEHIAEDLARLRRLVQALEHFWVCVQNYLLF